MDALVVVSTGFRYHFKCGTLVSAIYTLTSLSAKVIQYDDVDRHPVVATG